MIVPPPSALLLAASCLIVSCSSSSSPGAPDGSLFSAPVCVEPTTSIMEPNLATLGNVACLDVGLRAGGQCPAALVAGLCPLSLSIVEIASFVELDAGGYSVLMRSGVTGNDRGALQSDGRTITELSAGDDITISSALSSGARIRVQLRFTGSSVTIASLDHEDPF